ncbi:MAG: rhodanese-like domain-containing protein [Candidatus Spechtbacterales bacterium]|nr:rhodanese-like domain-containing protein [Candidatus Spechtbacterales bacterium]
MPDYKIVSAKDVKNKLEEGGDVLVINVLSESSFNSMHIPGSINIDVHQDDFLENVKKATGGDKDKEIIVHCSSESCQASPGAARKLVEAGYTNVADFEGGLAGWKEAGYKLEGAMAE